MGEGDVPTGKRARRRLIRLVHLIGYVTTFIVIVEVGLLAWFFGDDMRRDWQRRAEAIESSRTQERPLIESEWEHQRNLISVLPPLGALHGDGVRILVMPSLGPKSYGIALSLAPGAAQAEGVLAVLEDPYGRPSMQVRRFAVPVDDYRRFAAELDALTDGWPGDDTQCLDGAPAGFERVRGSRVTSGIGNCSRHYGRLKEMTLAMVRRFAPGPDLPSGEGWYEAPPQRGPIPVHNAGVSSNTSIGPPGSRGASTRR